MSVVRSPSHNDCHRVGIFDSSTLHDLTDRVKESSELREVPVVRFLVIRKFYI
jgi:hypothetical protein